MIVFGVDCGTGESCMFVFVIRCDTDGVAI